MAVTADWTAWCDTPLTDLAPGCLFWEHIDAPRLGRAAAEGDARRRGWLVTKALCLCPPCRSRLRNEPPRTDVA